MLLIRTNILIILFMLSFTATRAQSGQFDASSNRSIKRIEKIAKNLERIGDYKGALNAWLTLDSVDNDNPEYLYRIGYCYLYTDQKSRAWEYMNLVKNSRKLPKDADYYFGRAYHLIDSFQQAIPYYQQFLDYEKKDEDRIREVKRLIENCKYGIEAIKTPVPVRIQNLGPFVNTPYHDYGPLVSIDEQVILFTSRRPGTTGDSFDPLIDEYYEDIYISQKVDGRWTEAKQLEDSVNTALHDACVGLSPVGNRLIMYRGNDNPFNPNRSGNLYYSDRTDSGWTIPVSFNENVNSRYWEPSASLTYDEQVMYFSSDRPGGFGGTDIYVVKSLPDGTWAMPVNMGPTINTPFDEDGPFIHPDGNKLYFSSEGHDSMGGFDIFSTEFDSISKVWQFPENLGYPINGGDDEVFFSFSYDGKRAYFSSAREDTYGATDIYMMTRMDVAGIAAIVSGKVKSINGGSVLTELIVENLDDNRVAGVYLTDSQTGGYSMVLETGKRYQINMQYGINTIQIPLDLHDVIPDSELSKDIIIDL